MLVDCCGSVIKFGSISAELKNRTGEAGKPAFAWVKGVSWTLNPCQFAIERAS